MEMNPVLKAETISGHLWKTAAKMLAAELLKAPAGPASAAVLLQNMNSIVQSLDRKMFAEMPEALTDAALLSFLSELRAALTPQQE